MSWLGEREVVVDMFAGIGIFSVSMAVHSRPKKITGIEINPESFVYLKENIRLNEVKDIFVPVCGDCSKAAAEETAARVLTGWEQHITILNRL